MNISFSIPLSKGWERMKKALFQPFDLNKWMRVGLTAWLAGLTDCNGGGSGGGNNNHGRADLDEFFRFPETAWNWLQSHPLWFNLIILGFVFLVLIVIVLTWVSSRGKFMFLHNVIHDRSDINLPWTEYRKEGNSLFLWQILFNLVISAPFVLFLIYVFNSAKTMYYGDFPGILVFWKIAGLILMFFGFLIITGYISLIVKDFVVPLMYKYRLGILAGWSKLLPVLGRYFYLFIVYGLFIFVLWIAAVAAVLFFGLLTCCIGWLLLALPYIGAVLFLPVSYTFRALSIEFLAQFGEEYNVFPETTIKTYTNPEQLPTP